MRLKRKGFSIFNNEIVKSLAGDLIPKHKIKEGILGAGIGDSVNKLVPVGQYIKDLGNTSPSKQISSESSQETLTPMLPMEYDIVSRIMSDPKTISLAKKIKDTHEQWDNLLGVFKEDVIQNSKEQFPILFALGHRYGFAYNFNNSGWFLVKYYGYSNKERPVPIGLSPKNSIINALEEMKKDSECTPEKINLLDYQLIQIKQKL